jgi:hypothetical protein
MSKTEFRKFWQMHREGRSLKGYANIKLEDGRYFLDAMRHLVWRVDRLAAKVPA